MVLNKHFHVVGICIENTSPIACMPPNIGSIGVAVCVAGTVLGASIAANAAVVIAAANIHCHTEHSATT